MGRSREAGQSRHRRRSQETIFGGEESKVINSIPIYVITMPVRRSYITEHLDSFGLHYQIVPAFDGRKIGLSTSIPYLRDHDSGYWSSHPQFFIGPGVNALVLTNMMIMKMAVMSEHKEILVLEDDAILCPNFIEEFDKTYRELPSDYRMCHFQACCHNAMRKHSDRLSKGLCLCTAAMLYQGSWIEMLLDRAKLGAPWDVFLFDQLDSAGTFIATPELVKQKSLVGEMPTTLS